MDLNKYNGVNSITAVCGGMLLALCFLVSGCTKTELNETERGLVAKQELADRFDKLFYEGFENPDETEKKLREFELNDLVSNDKNLLTDQDIRVDKSMIEMTIRLRRIQNTLETELNKGTIFDGFIQKNRVLLNCKSVLQELPYRARKGKKYEYLETKVADIERLINETLTKKERSLGPIPNELLGKQWKWKIDFDPYQFNSADLYSDIFKKLKDFSFDFHFNNDNTITAKRFFLAPVIIEGSASFDAAGDWTPALMGDKKIECYAYNHKLFFYVPMIDNADFNTGRGNVAHAWYYEYDYKVEGNELILTMNRVGLYTMVNQFITTKNDDEMEYSYAAAFKSFTLSSNSL